MRTPLQNTLAAALVFSAGIARAASFGTAFTYQGRLQDGTNAANGIYDLQFTTQSAEATRSDPG
jgi:hypothetical protein